MRNLPIVTNPSHLAYSRYGSLDDLQPCAHLAHKINRPPRCFIRHRGCKQGSRNRAVCSHKSLPPFRTVSNLSVFRRDTRCPVGGTRSSALIPFSSMLFAFLPSHSRRSAARAFNDFWYRPAPYSSWHISTERHLVVSTNPPRARLISCAYGCRMSPHCVVLSRDDSITRYCKHFPPRIRA